MDRDDRWQAAESGLRDEIERLGRLFEETRNPIFAWAVLSCQQFWRIRSRLLKAPPPPLILPDWVQDYLAASGWRLLAMADDLDFQEQPHVLGEPMTTRVRSIAPAVAAERVAKVLGLLSPGSNEFKNYRSTAADIVTARLVQRFQAQGLTYEAALVKASSAKANERSVVAKRTARGRALLNKLRTKQGALH